MSNDGVAAVEKALSLLDCFQPGKKSLSLAALSKTSGSWTAKGQPDLLSFAAITDEPPPEVSAAGHDGLHRAGQA